MKEHANSRICRRNKKSKTIESGRIRNNMKRIYRSVVAGILICAILMMTVGVQASVVENGASYSISTNSISEWPQGPDIYAETAILMDADTGAILYNKGMDEKRYPASITKIMTCMLALEHSSLDEQVTFTETCQGDQVAGSGNAGMQVGEVLTMRQCLLLLMIRSANDVATQIAEHVGGSVEAFVDMMNQKAQELGCMNTHFVNASGMPDDNHYSTAYDMALIARYCMKNEKFREYAALKEASLPRTEYWQDEQVEKNGERIFYNTNNLMQKDSKFYYPTCIGIKSGFTTPAKNCLVSASNKNGFELISVILHAESTDDGQSARYVDTINLFNYGYENYNLSDILEEYDMIEDNEDKNDSEESIGKIVEIENNLLEDSLVEEELTNKLDKNIIKIVIGIICIIIGIFIFCKGKKGKHEEISKLYKFNL